MIVLEKITKRYGNITALDELTLNIEKGQVLGLLGQNGAGKSTLLNVISGYTPATTGRITIGSADMLSSPRRAKSHIGFLPEHPPLYPEMTVYEYLLFCTKLKGVVPQDRNQHISEIIGMTGLESVRTRLIANLSKGFQQRVGLAQALCGSPDVLLLDEPSTGFDPSQMYEFRRTIQSLAKLHTVILSSHLLSEVSSICDRITILHHGKLVYDHLKDDSPKNKQFFVRIDGKIDHILPSIRDLSSVIKVKPILDRNIFEANIVTKPEHGFEKQLFCLLSGLGIPILELRQVQDSLEDIFMNITAADIHREADN